MSLSMDTWQHQQPGILGPLPADIIACHILPNLDPADALSLAMSCKPLYTMMFCSVCPTFRVQHYGGMFLVGQCIHDMIRAVRAAPPRMLGFYFSHEWQSRFGSPLNRGFCMFIVKVKEGHSVFTINGSRRNGLTDSQAAQLLWDSVIRVWPHLDLRTGCSYKSERRKEAVYALSNKLVSLLAQHHPITGKNKKQLETSIPLRPHI
jgi:hypothetical protein